MRRRIMVVFVLALMLLALGAAPAFGKVHGVSQASCAAVPGTAGANASGANSPAGQIPVTASADAFPNMGVPDFQGQGGMDAGFLCDAK